MTILPEDDRRKSNRRQSHRRKANMESTKIGGEVDKGQEVTVHCGTAPQREEKTIFSWFEEFTMAWSRTLILRK